MELHRYLPPPGAADVSQPIWCINFMVFLSLKICCFSAFKQNYVMSVLNQFRVQLRFIDRVPSHSIFGSLWY